ncbi:MAG: prepilin-type N-terminal cleavage/methylation domain-containing protein [Candidatus Taylorbacteria bacterium]|nr:prepilin-type N-terminal cleavage/methylation domain-containing protein [Candidatus Taylorbacteria bacterium]
MDKRGFTLIELLVVISIVSLLSSVALASLNSARDRADLAAGKRFAAHARSALAAKSANNAPLVYLTFDSGSGASSILNSGLLSGSVGTWNASFQADSSLYGTGQHMRGPTATLSYPLVWAESGGSRIGQAISALDFTMSIWFNPNGSSYASACGGPCRIISNAQDGNNTSMRITTSGAITFLIEGTQVLSYALSPKDSWYHLAFTSANRGSTIDVALYVNGRQVATASRATLSFSAPVSNISVGGACCSSYVLPNALYDDAAFFDSALLARDIRELYLAGGGDREAFARR